MATINITISIEESLLQRVDELAAELKISRNELVSMALEHFIKASEAERLAAKSNETDEPAEG